MQSSPTFPYRLERTVGEGAMGTVHLAWDPDLQRRVAIKVMRRDWLDALAPEAAEDARRRFLQEARAAAALSHPGVTVIHRIGEEEGQPYIVMEFLEGETLESVLKRRGALPPNEAARIGMELAEALDAAHEGGIVHRDVKPSNLILLSSGRLKVTDFGIARIQGSELVKTQAGDVLATPKFGSPEQLAGQEIDGRSDLFSVGIVLYIALTGTAPFEGRNLAEVVSAILYSEPVPPRRRKTAIPPGLEAVVLRLLEKKPEKRFARARDLAEALGPFVSSGGSGPGGSAGDPASFEGRDEAATRLDLDRAARVVTGVPGTPSAAVAAVVTGWPARPLGRAGLAGLLSRLLEFPIHAEPFAGGVRIGRNALLLLHHGWILSAIDLSGSRTGDEVVDAFGAEEEAELFPVPASPGSAVIPLLASLLAPRCVKHEGLDSSFVNLPALARKLEEEKFDGVITLRRQGATGWILLDRGRTALSLFTGGWGEAPLDRPWTSWVSDLAVQASVEEKGAAPAFESFRRLLKDFPAVVEEGSDPEQTRLADSGARRLSSSTILRAPKRGAAGPAPARRVVPAGAGLAAAAGPPRPVVEEAFALDPARRFLSWTLEELPAALEARGKSEVLKYVTTWLPLVRSAVLHHDLPRPNERTADFFDVVTFDGEGKALHVAYRVARGSEEAVTAFVERVKAAKAARTKTGDVGAAFLIAPAFDDRAANAWQAATTTDGETSWAFGAIDKATSYEAFVRMGPRRGFHLVLVAETRDGFEVALP